MLWGANIFIYIIGAGRIYTHTHMVYMHVYVLHTYTHTYVYPYVYVFALRSVAAGRGREGCKGRAACTRRSPHLGRSCLAEMGWQSSTGMPEPARQAGPEARRRDLEQEARNRAEAQKRRRLLSAKYGQPGSLRDPGPVQQGRLGEVHGVLPFVSAVAGLRVGGRTWRSGRRLTKRCVGRAGLGAVG